MKIKLTLRLLAPYLAVGFFWCVLSNAWLAILAYHVQILLWSRTSLAEQHRTMRPRLMLMAVPAALAGPLLYFLLPYMTHADLAVWLTAHHLSRFSLAAMIPYFGLVHPVLEQIHWVPLRQNTAISHPAFAGYHVVVLCTLLTIPWLVLCFAVLTTASLLWQRMVQRSGSIAAPVASHVLADLGIIIAAWLKT